MKQCGKAVLSYYLTSDSEAAFYSHKGTGDAGWDGGGRECSYVL